LISVIAALSLAPSVLAANQGDFSGAVAIGTGYAGIDAAPTNGLIVQGTVGIGTSSPIYPLDVKNSGFNQIHISSDGSDTQGYIVANSTGLGFGAQAANDGTNWIAKSTLASITAMISGTVNFYTDTGLTVGSSYAPTLRMTVNSSGNVGIGTTAPSYLLHVGSSSASGAVAGFQNSADLCTLTPAASSPTWSCSSDIRLKMNIADTGNGLASLEGMRVRDFTMKSTGERQTGVIAQELTTVHPDMVHMGSNGFYTVDSPSPWVLVKAIQELNSKITEQQKEIDTLKQTTKHGAGGQ
jgi:hypothetical protein